MNGFLFSFCAVVLSLSQVLAQSSAKPLIKIDGSSTVFPIAEAFAEDFQTSQKGQVKVTVGISGTGGGFKKFCKGETDLQNASRPIQSSEMEICKKAGIKYFEVPVAFDATVVVVNPNNTFLNQITVEELKKIWEPEAQGKILTWNQVNSAWPKEKLTLFGAGTDSGTFDYFTEAIVGKAKASRGDYTASEDDNTLVMGISRDKNSLGYVPYAYYEANKNKLKALAIIGGAKHPKKAFATKAVAPSKASVEDGSYYPLSRPVFMYLNEASYKKPEIEKFMSFLLKEASTLVPQSKYVALPASVYQLAQEHLKAGKVGTVFGGHSEIGLSIQELVKKEKAL